jgi:hypothetical protein
MHLYNKSGSVIMYSLFALSEFSTPTLFVDGVIVFLEKDLGWMPYLRTPIQITIGL